MKAVNNANKRMNLFRQKWYNECRTTSTKRHVVEGENQ